MAGGGLGISGYISKFYQQANEIWKYFTKALLIDERSESLTYMSHQFFYICPGKICDPGITYAGK